MLGKIRNKLSHIYLPNSNNCQDIAICLINSSESLTLWKQFKGQLWLVHYKGTPDLNGEYTEMTSTPRKLSPGAPQICLLDSLVFFLFQWNRRWGEHGARSTADWEKDLTFQVYSLLNKRKVIATLLMEGHTCCGGASYLGMQVPSG